MKRIVELLINSGLPFISKHPKITIAIGILIILEIINAVVSFISKEVNDRLQNKGNNNPFMRDLPTYDNPKRFSLDEYMQDKMKESSDIKGKQRDEKAE